MQISQDRYLFAKNKVSSFNATQDELIECIKIFLKNNNQKYCDTYLNLAIHYLEVNRVNMFFLLNNSNNKIVIDSIRKKFQNKLIRDQLLQLDLLDITLELINNKIIDVPNFYRELIISYLKDKSNAISEISNITTYITNNILKFQS
ncbi:MAG: hypothetical protein CMF62_00630 [Magnetococcales bacterium]|nr:hypothetical protein [Magnetococcales bacterium]|tara:strand:- start:19080 stop:19520 length:441 start_codon:yes stop_codon:yes gene_type:complete